MSDVAVLFLAIVAAKPTSFARIAMNRVAAPP
jgi:hypothetical protein